MGAHFIERKKVGLHARLNHIRARSAPAHFAPLKIRFDIDFAERVLTACDRLNRVMEEPRFNPGDFFNSDRDLLKA